MLIGNFQGELKQIKFHLQEINAQCSEFSAVPEALKVSGTPDMVVVFADKNIKSIKADIALLQQSTLSEIPRLFILPRGMSDLKPDDGLIMVDGEPAFQVPVDKLTFLSFLARLLKIPQRRVFRIIITVHPDGSNIKYSGMSLDFSETGMSFQCVEDIQVDQLITVFFVNPKNRKRFSLRAKVVRKTSTQTGGANFYGITFLEMNDEDARALMAFITGKGFV